MQEEAEAFSQLEALAGNLGWDEVAESASETRKALIEAAERIADAVEATVKVQAEAKHDHAFEHDHGHTHSHCHPHEHEHGD